MSNKANTNWLKLEQYGLIYNMLTIYKKNKYNLKIALSLCLVFIVVLTAFAPCLKNGFVNWDDDKYINKNSAVQSLSLANFEKIFTSFFMGHYQPITILSYASEFHFFKLSAFGYHLINLILHILNCLLVFWLIFILTKKISVSWITSLLFGIHPLQVESVAWISERKSVLYAFFFIGAMICYLYYIRRRESSGCYYFSLFLFILSILSKSAAVTLPLVLFICDFFYRRDNKGIIIEKIPYFILSIVFGIVAIIGVRTSQAIRQEGLYSLLDKLLTASYGTVFYLTKIFLPIRLSALYSYYEVKSIFLYLYSLAAVILVIAIIISARHTKKIVFGSSFFLLSIFPALQFIPNGQIIAADRYVYIPSIGIFYILAEWFVWLFSRTKKHIRIPRALPLAILIMIVTFFVLLTRARCQVWKDSVTLWSDVLNKYPNVVTAYKNRGEAYALKGNFDRAIFDFVKGLSLNPNDPGLYINLGNAYANKGNFDQAFSNYGKALQIDPMDAGAYYNRAVTYLLKKEYDSAWQDIHNAERMGYKVNADFIEELKRVSGRGK